MAHCAQPHVVLVTGAGRLLGTRLAARLSTRPDVGRTIAVDTVPPRSAFGGLGRAEFVRADIGHPLIGKIIEQAGVDTVVHAGVALPRVRPRHVDGGEEHLDAATSLLQACARAETVRRVVLGSSTAVYSSRAAGPSVCTESDVPRGELRGAGRSAFEIEARLRLLSRERPDIDTLALRFAPLVGPAVDSWLTSYLDGPIVPTVLGYDARLQVLHENDAVDAMAIAALDRRAAIGLPDPRSARGALNIAGDGVVMLSQALRWALRIRMRLPATAMRGVLAATRPTRVATEDLRFHEFGRVVDTGRARAELGFAPRFSTADALRAHLDRHRPTIPGLSAVPGVPTAFTMPTIGEVVVGSAQRLLALGRSS